MNNPWVSVIKVCSNGGATYIILEIIAKNNLKNKSSSPKHLNRNLKYCNQIDLVLFRIKRDL